jgi:hypothetical protein
MRFAKARACGNALDERPVLPHGPSGKGCVPSPCGVPFETSKTSRSFVLAVSSSTIKKLSEYMIVKVLLFAIPASLGKRFQRCSTAKEIRIKARTQRRLVPIIVFEMRSLLVSGNGTYQPGVKSGSR